MKEEGSRSGKASLSYRQRNGALIDSLVPDNSRPGSSKETNVLPLRALNERSWKSLKRRIFRAM